MKDFASHSISEQPHLVRLERLAQLAPAEIEALMAAGRNAASYSARRDVVRADVALRGPRILLAGWAAQVRNFRDGRRQILHLLLPGDVVTQEAPPYAAPTILALTDVSVAPAPIAAHRTSGLGLAYALSAAIERSCLQRQIARIGRLDAQERIADLFLELVERLSLAGIPAVDGFELPVTQEMLGDCLGLTSVHVNRMLQQMRREGLIDDRGRTMRLIDPDRLRAIVDYQPLVIERRDC